MAKNTVANIGVDLTAKIAGFEANMNKATKKLSSSQARMNKSLKRIEGGFAALGKKIAAFAGIAGAGLALRSLNNLSEKAIDFGDNLAKTADKLGIDIEVLQEFRFAAERAGIAQTTLDTAVQRFIRRTAEAAQGTGEAKAALKELGIELKDSDGNLRPVEQLLSDVADGFQKLKSPAGVFREKFQLAKHLSSKGKIIFNHDAWFWKKREKRKLVEYKYYSLYQSRLFLNFLENI
mgnify:CR=1 FL=1